MWMDNVDEAGKIEERGERRRVEQIESGIC
jgi:hypothetical protein